MAAVLRRGTEHKVDLSGRHEKIRFELLQFDLKICGRYGDKREVIPISECFFEIFKGREYGSLFNFFRDRADITDCDIRFIGCRKSLSGAYRREKQRHNKTGKSFHKSRNFGLICYFRKSEEF